MSIDEEIFNIAKTIQTFICQTWPEEKSTEIIIALQAVLMSFEMREGYE